MKHLLLIGLVFFLAACGSPVQKSTFGYVEETQLVLMADRLVGLKISIGSISNREIKKSDLKKYRLGVLGVKDSDRENLQTAIFAIEKGEHNLVVTDGNQVVYGAVLFFNNGQTREVRIK